MGETYSKAQYWVASNTRVLPKRRIYPIWLKFHLKCFLMFQVTKCAKTFKCFFIATT